MALLIVWVAFVTTPAFADNDGFIAYYQGDYVTALREYRPLAEQGDTEAQYYLGQIYESGLGIPQDYKEAAKWFTLAAEQGDLGSQYFLGLMHSKGYGVPKDYVRAHMWFNLATATRTALYGNLNEEIYGKAGEARDTFAKKMTPAQIEKAQDLAKKCLAKDYKGC